MNEAMDSQDILSRYILYHSHIRADGTVRPDAFIPHPYPDLSVTLNRGISDDTVWEYGEAVATERGMALRGRAENNAAAYLGQNLSVIADPVEGNPNHVVVRDWPAEKAAQKMVALEISAVSTFIPRLTTPAPSPQKEETASV